MFDRIIIYLGFGLFILAGVAATHPQGEEKQKKRNLKVLPKDIDDEVLDVIMNKMDKDLGVTCNYCHAATKPGIFPMRADFTSDEKPEKLIARKMMIMTAKINSKYFGLKHMYDPQVLRKQIISCNTCHHGLTHPSKNRLYF